MSAFYAVIITINFITGLSILISGLKKEHRHFKAFSILSFICIVYTLATWNIHLSKDIEQALFFSKLQLATLFSGLPIFLYTFSKWCRVKGANLLSASIGFGAFVIIIFNFASETSLRYGADAALIYHASPYWGNFVSVSGSASPLFYVFQSIVVITGILGFWFGSRLFVKESKWVGAMVIITMGGQLIVTWLGSKIDGGDFSMFYIGNVPFTILSVFMMFRLAHFLKLSRIDVSAEREKLIDLKNDFFELAKSVSDPLSNVFFENMLKTIYSFSRSEVIFIGLVNENQTAVKSTLALQQGHITENFDYELRGTPCQEVVDNKVCIYPENVAALFPEDHLLADMGISSYLGLPLMNAGRLPTTM